ncbi:MAG: lycopene cyclase [Ekhidna sp.]|nr:lycopene cyclase [Ekhidna sp.]
MSTQTFDYAIVGAGAAGMHLALKMIEDDHFQEKKILIIEKDKKEDNDRTWSFWEPEETRWDKLAENKWKKAFFTSKEGRLVSLDLKEYTYKTVRSSKFYAYCKDLIANAKNVTWIEEDVNQIKGSDIYTNQGMYHANHIFDSRIDPEFIEKEKEYASLSQHFLGWFIETPTPVFDDSSITMMDYQLQWKDHTSFTYILPFSPTYALVEFTLFNNEMLSHDEYEEKLKTYLSEQLNIEEYKIVEVEKGVIPMSNYPFTKHHEPALSKIGTAGSWVRPSSGYSFKNGDRYSSQVIENIKKGKSPHNGIAKNRFRFYDSIFLTVLKEENNLGAMIFETLYTKHDITSVFRFLDEQSSIIEDLRIILSLNIPAFRKALLKVLQFGKHVSS